MDLRKPLPAMHSEGALSGITSSEALVLAASPPSTTPQLLSTEGGPWRPGLRFLPSAEAQGRRVEAGCVDQGR